MKVARLALLFCIFSAAIALGEDTNTSITIDGVTYENFRWGTVTPTTVSIFHRTGVGTIPLEKLPLELQKQFGYDPQKITQRKAPQQKVETPSLVSTGTTTNGGLKHPAELKGVISNSNPAIVTRIVFVNKSKDLRLVYWLDFKGERQLYMKLKPGEMGGQLTYLGHPWLVTDAQNNALGLYYPDGEKRVVILE